MQRWRPPPQQKSSRSWEIFLRSRLVVHGDAAATSHDIVTHELLYRWGFVAEIFVCFR